jgi:hypothetical protein
MTFIFENKINNTKTKLKILLINEKFYLLDILVLLLFSFFCHGSTN